MCSCIISRWILINQVPVADNGTINTHVNLLDNVPVFRIAEFDDLDGSLMIKTDGRKVYLIEEVSGEFLVTLPIVADYAFQPLSAARIEILPPTPKGATDSWFVRVTNGKFFTNITGGLRKYHIAEFLSQSFSPEPPIKNIATETSTILDSTLIKLDQENIHEDDDLSLFVNIMIDDANDIGLAAFTTDSSIVGNIATNGQAWVQWSNATRLGIRSIDHATGFVDIDGLSLKTGWTATSSYHFLEDKYEFTLINFNPISNREALSTRVSLFIDPDTSITSESQTLFFLKSDETGRVVESNWPDFDNDTQEYIPSGLDLYYEAFPGWKPPELHVKFIDLFTVEGTEDGDFLVLGDVTAAPAAHPGELEKIDSRRRGGGIIDTEIAAALLSNPEVQWYWDEGYWDGTPFPGNASYLAQVPVDTLEDAGGNFTQAQVRDIVERHTAAGVYAAAQAYGVEITVSGVFPGSDLVTLRWTSDEY